MNQKLDPEFKAKWVAALRSGEYEQCIGTMRRPDENGRAKYCCMGVACEIVDAPFQYDNMPDPLLNGCYSGGKIAHKVVSMNDGIGEDPKSFSEIANWIEENL